MVGLRALMKAGSQHLFCAHEHEHNVVACRSVVSERGIIAWVFEPCSSHKAVILTVTTAILPDLGEDGRCFIPRLLLLTFPG